MNTIEKRTKMIRIVIYNQSLEISQKIFEVSNLFVRNHKVSAEVSFSTNIKVILEKFNKDLYYYDIFILGTDDNSLKFASIIRKNNYLASIVFISSNINPKHNILKYRPTAYIGNITSDINTESALEDVVKEQLSFKPYFIVKCKDIIMRIHYKDILFFESNHRTITIHTKKESIRFYAKLSEIDAQLPFYQFIRCHQSYIVNLENTKILNKTDKQFILSNGEKIKISEKYYLSVVDIWGRLLK